MLCGDHEPSPEATIAVTLPPGYKDNAGTIARRRVVEAGFRLARAIEDALGESATAQ